MNMVGVRVHKADPYRPLVGVLMPEVSPRIARGVLDNVMTRGQPGRGGNPLTATLPQPRDRLATASRQARDRLATAGHRL